ncbi:glyoxylate pathway regulator [Ceratobasidium sp. AG-Ba]|nr:glyoxylate pathway regulator [Ceratobasidium sp. AG-Ba]QRW04538.1 glyoxylate pathway regulator [Ceratobasidium sp. AG-Ba]
MSGSQVKLAEGDTVYEVPRLQYSTTNDSQPAFPQYHRKFANPGPLGLFAFASTILILSLFNVGARGITVTNAILGMALAVGGLCQLLAGMWEFASGNTFGATVFSMYGGFWLSFGTIFIPGSGILDAYKGEADQLSSALGIYMTAWTIVTFLFFLATFRSSMALVAVFSVLLLALIALSIAQFTQSLAAQKAGGVLGVITAILAFYTGSAGLFTPDSTYFVLPVGDLPKSSMV